MFTYFEDPYTYDEDDDVGDEDDPLYVDNESEAAATAQAAAEDLLCVALNVYTFAAARRLILQLQCGDA